MSEGTVFAGEVLNSVSPPTAFQTEGKLYLILDFLRGGDLFTRLSKEVSDPAANGDFLSWKTGREERHGRWVCEARVC